MRKLELHWKILIGMFLGVLFAFIMVNFSWGPEFVSDFIKPFGTIFINAVKAHCCSPYSSFADQRNIGP